MMKADPLSAVTPKLGLQMATEHIPLVALVLILMCLEFSHHRKWRKKDPVDYDRFWRIKDTQVNPTTAKEGEE